MLAFVDESISCLLQREQRSQTISFLQSCRHLKMFDCTSILLLGMQFSFLEVTAFVLKIKSLQRSVSCPFTVKKIAS